MCNIKSHHTPIPLPHGMYIVTNELHLTLHESEIVKEATMSYQHVSPFPNAIVPPKEAMNPQFEFMPPGIQGEPQQAHKPKPETTFYHGEALARDPWAEHYAHWIVLGFTTVFAFLLLIMLVGGQVP